MLRTICDYHTPIIDIWQKPTLQIKWFYTRQDYEIVLDYLMNILEETSFDYVRYSNGLWYGVILGICNLLEHQVLVRKNYQMKILYHYHQQNLLI